MLEVEVPLQLALARRCTSARCHLACRTLPLHPRHTHQFKAAAGAGAVPIGALRSMASLDAATTGVGVEACLVLPKVAAILLEVGVSGCLGVSVSGSLEAEDPRCASAKTMTVPLPCSWF